VIFVYLIDNFSIESRLFIDDGSNERDTNHPSNQMVSKFKPSFPVLNWLSMMTQHIGAGKLEQRHNIAVSMLRPITTLNPSDLLFKIEASVFQKFLT